ISWLFCCFYDGRVVKRELPSGNIVTEQKAMMEKGRGFSNWALSADGRFLAGSAITWPPVRRGGQLREDWEEVPPPEIHIWDTARLTHLETLTGHEGEVRQLAFSSDGQSLISGGGFNDSTPLLRFWDLKDLGSNSNTGANGQIGQEKTASLPSVKVVK